mgnify:CR=1 FL=1
MKAIFRLLTVLTVGLLLFSFGSKRGTQEPIITKTELNEHIAETRDTLNSLEGELRQTEHTYLDSLLIVEKKNLQQIQASIHKADTTDLQVAKQTCEEITAWVGITLQALSGSGD